MDYIFNVSNNRLQPFTHLTLLSIQTANELPIMGAEIYIHKNCNSPDIMAGPNERAGFIEAPEMGPAKSASNKTTAPIAIPAMMPCSLLPCETRRMTNIKKKVNSISKRKDCITLPAGNVPPNCSFNGNNKCKVKLAKIAPTL